jgi:hypothetical protein
MFSSDDFLKLGTTEFFCCTSLAWVGLTATSGGNPVFNPVFKTEKSKFQAEKSCQVGFNVFFYGGSTHERLLSESSRSYTLAFLSVFVCLVCSESGCSIWL